MPRADISPELLEEMMELIYDWKAGVGCTEELCAELVRAVRRDFALAGVHARGLTSEQARIMGAKGASVAGRPRRGETPEEARMRRLGISTGEIQAVIVDAEKVRNGRNGRGL